MHKILCLFLKDFSNIGVLQVEESIYLTFANIYTFNLKIKLISGDASTEENFRYFFKLWNTTRCCQENFTSILHKQDIASYDNNYRWNIFLQLENISHFYSLNKYGQYVAETLAKILEPRAVSFFFPCINFYYFFHSRHRYLCIK